MASSKKQSGPLYITSRRKSSRFSQSRRRPLHVEPLEARWLLSATSGIDIYHEDFESGDGGFTVNNSGGTLPGLWHYSLGRYADGLSGHTPFHNFYYGAGETPTGGGRYDVLPFDHQGVIVSPPIPLPADGITQLSFNYLLDTRPELNVDFVEVSVVDGTSVTPILSRANSTLPETGGIWLCQMADLSAFNGKSIQLRFSFDTGDVPRVDPEGWYVDDIRITNEPPPPDISGYKWDDQDADGMWDPSEPGLNGWTVYLDENNNDMLDTGEPSVTTQNDGMHDGAFSFTGLTAGSYTVREVLPHGWKQSYPGSPTFEHVVSINPPSSVRVNGRYGVAEPPNFGNFQPDISGYKWDDQDADGVWDAGEPGLNGWMVYLDENNNDALEPGEPSFTTQNDGMHDGAFWFKGLAAGNYTVREVLPHGWKQSYPGSPTFKHVVFVNPPSSVRVNGRYGVAEPPNLGNFRPDISGYKWDDQDADGVWDAGEPGLNGWTVFLDENNNDMLDAGEPLFTTQNDGMHDGVFWFNGLTAGNHTVREVLPHGWKQSFPGSPNFEHVVPIDPPNGVRVNGNYGVAESPNFGNFQPDISGYKWDDQDADGMWDAGEPGLNGWTIYLDLDASGTLNNQPNGMPEPSFVTQNDSTHDGAYWFTGLTARDYAVREVLQNGWAQSYPGPTTFAHNVTVDPPNNVRVNAMFEDTAVPNFGNAVAGSVEGYKWDDVNRDGVWDAGESGLSGVTIENFSSSPFHSPKPPPVDQMTTGSNGEYAFHDLLPGNYWVCEVVPVGRMQTYPSTLPCHPITITAGQTISGQSGVAEVPNFGNALIMPPSADVEIVTKLANRVTVQPGEILTYTITFFNNGPAAAVDAKVTDTVPAGTTYVGATILRGPNWQKTKEPLPGGIGDIEFSNPSAPAFDLAVFEIVVMVETTTTPGGPDDPIQNNACASRVTTDPDPANDCKDTQTPVAPPPNGTISGLKFNDRNGDGVRQPNGADGIPQTADDEEPLEDWTIVVYGDDGDGMLSQAERSAGTVTGGLTLADGSYSLGLPVGSYIILEVVQSGWMQTFPLEDPPIDVAPGIRRGDVIAAGVNRGSLGEGGYAVTISQPAQQITGLDFGNMMPEPPPIVSGTKFRDDNDNGQIDPGTDQPEQGWEIRAYPDLDGNGRLSDLEKAGQFVSDTTASNGEYSLSLEPGSYIVVEILQCDWQQRQPLTDVVDAIPGVPGCPVNPDIGELGYAVTLAAGQTLEGRDFLNFPPGTPETAVQVTGEKFEDVNRNGTKDIGELGIDNWEIRFYLDTISNGLLDPGEYAAGPETTAFTFGLPSSPLDPPLGSYLESFNSSLGSGNRTYLVVEVLKSRYRQVQLPGTVPILAGGLITPGETLGPYGHIFQVNEGDNFNEVDVNFANYRCTGKRCFLSSNRR